MTELTGAPGELVERFVQLAGVPLPEDPQWPDRLGIWLHVAITSAVPNFGDHIEPDLASKLRQRLIQLTTNGGLDEGFLVKALADHLEAELVHLADKTETNTRREEGRQALRHIADNADEYVGRLGSSAAEVRERAERMIEGDPTFQDVTPEEVARDWALLETWRKRREALLSDKDIQSWSMRRL